jgi:hypothetical protein
MASGAATLDRGEVPALNYLDQAESGGKLDANLRTQVVLQLARLLRIHTERYGAADIDANEQAAIAETIITAENLLKKITKPPDKSPDISRELQSGGDNPAINMQIELIQWIGSPQVSGVVNKAPWNVPPGAP